MAVRYDAGTQGFAVDPDYCPDCESPLYDTGCDAPGCTARCCTDCGTGCDIEIAQDAGRCAQALADEDDEAYEARIAAERAAFGLPEVTTHG